MPVLMIEITEDQMYALEAVASCLEHPSSECKAERVTVDQLLRAYADDLQATLENPGSLESEVTMQLMELHGFL